jgi:hypothetical protein
MPDMTLKGAHIENAREEFQHKALEARREIARLTAVAETYEQAERTLRYSIDQEKEKVIYDRRED